MAKPQKKAQKEQSVIGIIITIIIVGIFVVASISGAMYFITGKVVDNVKKNQDNIDENIEKLGSEFIDFKGELDEKLSMRQKQEDQQQESRDEKNSIGIELFYYNISKDSELASDDSCSPDAVLPVSRIILVTATPIQETIQLLLRGELLEEERISGFTTEFPHPEFLLIGTQLRNGVLTLEFSNPLDFTTGGACRVGLLKSQIEKTALQFEGVESVEFVPETLFQP